MTLTDRELDIMSVLWDHGPSTVAEVRARLPDPLAHNTVATMLTILENKGHVRHVEEGRAFRFHPVLARAEAGRGAFARLVDRVFGGSAEMLITHFVADTRLSADELRRIRALLDERIGEAKRPRTRRKRR
jgi:BlaI family transcriptional regulator, penicillinase repressor